jgi:Uncharacterized protein conserved in bacteria
MSIRVALFHQSLYDYSSPVRLTPQLIRLRPTAHCRSLISSYGLRIEPQDHFLNWIQDPLGNWVARVVFPEPVTRFAFTVDLLVDMTIQNPFDFFLEERAERWPFTYTAQELRELKPWMQQRAAGPRLHEHLRTIPRTAQATADFLVAINRDLAHRIRYLIRMEPGVQTPEQTLAIGSGSCRDSAWLLVQILRHLGFAARFVSGYLIQLKPDVAALDGPSGTDHDFTDLHAWTEVYLPGAGWIGLDPTSGLLAAEGHLPLFTAPDPAGAAPVSGGYSQIGNEAPQVEFQHRMRIDRVYESARVTLPYDDRQWAQIDALGMAVDRRLMAADVRLTMGGEPTFVAIDHPQEPEWNIAAVGPTKEPLAEVLLERLRRRLAPDGLVTHGQGKWYPGESLPRWARGLHWRSDGAPLLHAPLTKRSTRPMPPLRPACARRRTPARRRPRKRAPGLRGPLPLPASRTSTADQRRRPRQPARQRRGARTADAGVHGRTRPAARLCAAGAALAVARLGQRALAPARRRAAAGAGRFADRLPPAAGQPAVAAAGRAADALANRPLRSHPTAAAAGRAPSAALSAIRRGRSGPAHQPAPG